jgi:hypothetical protein
LPPTAKNVQTMPNKREPQPLPNAELDKPIVITKMANKKDRIVRKKVPFINVVKVQKFQLSNH